MAFCTILIIINTITLFLIGWTIVNNQNKMAEGLHRIYTDINALDKKD
jgi:hypothetical protein